MTVNYFLFIVFAGNMQVVGPFHGLIACEKAGAQARIAVRKATAVIIPPRLSFSAICLSQKHFDFKFKAPK